MTNGRDGRALGAGAGAGGEAVIGCTLGLGPAQRHPTPMDLPGTPVSRRQLAARAPGMKGHHCHHRTWWAKVGRGRRQGTHGKSRVSPRTLLLTLVNGVTLPSARLM